MSGWSATAPGISEARLDALVNLLQSGLTVLNTALTYDSLWPANIVITDSMVRLGDIDNIPAREIAPILFCVEKADGDQTLIQRSMDNSETSGFVHYLTTNLYVYLHPMALGTTEDYVAKRERILARIDDWITSGLCNKRTNLILTLSSSVFKSPDTLQGNIELVEPDYFGKNFAGNTRMRGSRFVHKGLVG